MARCLKCSKVERFWESQRPSHLTQAERWNVWFWIVMEATGAAPRCRMVVQWMRSVLGWEKGTLMRAATEDSRRHIDSMGVAFPLYDGEDTVMEMPSTYEMKS